MIPNMKKTHRLIQKGFLHTTKFHQIFSLVQVVIKIQEEIEDIIKFRMNIM